MVPLKCEEWKDFFNQKILSKFSRHHNKKIRQKANKIVDFLLSKNKDQFNINHINNNNQL